MNLIGILLLAAALPTTNIKLANGKTLTVEVAAPGIEAGQGLAGRNSIAPDSGIVLVYLGDTRTKYNLMGYPGPVDILYLDEKKTIINLRENAAPCRIANCGYDSIWSHRYAVQLAAGTVKRYNIHAGDVLAFDLPPGKINLP